MFKKKLKCHTLSIILKFLIADIKIVVEKKQILIIYSYFCIIIFLENSKVFIKKCNFKCIYI